MYSFAIAFFIFPGIHADIASEISPEFAYVIPKEVLKKLSEKEGTKQRILQEFY